MARKGVTKTSPKRGFPFARGHGTFICLFAAGAVLRLLAWLAYKPAILVLPDTYGYLRVATVGSGVGRGWRPFFYSQFLRPLLLFEDLAVVTAVQHLLILGITVALYAVLRRLDVHPVVAAVGTAFLLLDGYQINLEQHILTEALFETLAVGGIVLLCWSQKAPVWTYCFAGVSLGLCSVTRFTGLALLPLALIYVTVRRIRWARIFAVVAGVAVPLVLYSMWFGNASGGAGLTNRTGYFLYGKVVGFADCSGVELPPAEAQLCLDQPPSKRRDFYQPWGRRSPLWRIDVPAGMDRGAIVASFTTRFIMQQPLDYLAAVARDFVRFFSWTSADQLRRDAMARWEFFDELRDVRADPRFRETAGSPPPELGLRQRFRLDEAMARKLRTYQSFAYVRGPLLALLVLLGVLGAVFAKHGRATSRARLSSMLFTACGLALYLFPASFSTFHYRYVLPAVPLIAAGGSLGASLLWDRMSLLVGSRGSS